LFVAFTSSLPRHGVSMMLMFAIIPVTLFVYLYYLQCKRYSEVRKVLSEQNNPQEQH
jgi:hypothetical protein